MSWLSKWLHRQVQDEERQEKMAAMVTPSTAMERMFGDCAPAMVAFKIDNGYVVRTMDVSAENMLSGHNVRSTGYHYCKDHAAIADHIVTEAAKEKMGLGGARYASADVGMAQASQPKVRR